MRALLLSGGMDSMALAYWQRPDIAFTIDYGQVAASAEINASRQIAAELDIAHEILSVDCRSLGSGDMSERPAAAVAPVPEWWPFRNQLLITIAGMRAVALGVTELILGSVSSDGSHADGRPDFYRAMDALMTLQEGGITVEAPALDLTTIELVRKSGIPRSLLAWSHSCHVGALACGACRGCVKHFEVTEQLYDDAY